MVILSTDAPSLAFRWPSTLSTAELLVAIFLHAALVCEHYIRKVFIQVLPNPFKMFQVVFSTNKLAVSATKEGPTQHHLAM